MAPPSVSESMTAPGVNARKTPGRLWVALIALGLISLLALFSGLKRNPGVALLTVACNVGLLIGLARGHRWAYVLTLVLALLGVTFAFARNLSQGLAVLVGNGIVLVPVLMSTSYFFPRGNPPNHGCR